MTKVRQAIITYDPDVVEGWSSASDASVSHIMWNALRGEDYPRERGIRSVRHVPPGNEIIIAPIESDDVIMSYNPVITLPLDMVERLLELARRATANAHGGPDKDLVRDLQAQIAGTRKRLEDFEIVLVPRLKLGDQR